MTTLRLFASFSLVLALGFSSAGCTTAFGRNINAGDAAMERGSWEPAISYYEAALRIDPDDEDAQRKLLAAKRAGIAQLVPSARADIAQGKVLEGVSTLGRARALGVNDASLDAAAREAAPVAFAAVDGYEAEERLESAVTLAEASARAVLPGRDGPSEVVRLRAKGASLALKWSDGFSESNRPALARFEIERALSFVPRHPAAIERVIAADHALAKQITFVAVISRFGADEASSALKDALSVTMMSRYFPPGGSVELHDDVPSNDPRIGLRLGGVFSDYKLVETRTAGTGSCDWVCGKDEVSNPDYARVQSAVSSAQSDLQSRMSSVNRARDARSRASSELQRERESLNTARERERRAQERVSQCQSSSSGCTSSELSEAERAGRERSSAEDDVSRAETRLSGAENDLMSEERRRDEAQSDVEEARSVLASTSRTIFVDRTCTQSFKTTNVHRHAEVLMGIEARALRDNTVIIPEEDLPLKDDRADVTYPAQPRTCPKSADPLTLPSESEQRLALVESSAKSVADRIRQAQQRARQDMLAQARAQTDPSGAAELYLQYFAARLTADDSLRAEVRDRTLAARHAWPIVFDGYAGATQPAKPVAQ